MQCLLRRPLAILSPIAVVIRLGIVTTELLLATLAIVVAAALLAHVVMAASVKE